MSITFKIGGVKLVQIGKYCNKPLAQVRYYTTSQPIKITFNTLIEEALAAEKLLYKLEYEKSAESFNAWISNVENYYDGQKIYDLQSYPLFAFSQYTPNMIMAFLGCPCDGECKPHVKELIKNKPEIEDSAKSTPLHYLAEYNSSKNAELYESLLTNLVNKNKQDLLLKKNISGNSPIEIAFLHNNKQFIKLAKEICGKPTISDLDNMDIYYYMSLKYDLDPEMELLLLGQNEPNPSIE